MKTLLSKKAFTLIEVLLSIAIFAAIALPLFSVFVQSFKTDRKAYDVLSANYISQDYIETLDAVNYKDALTERPQSKTVGGYYLTAAIKPYGTVDSLFDDECGYVHLVMNADGSMLAVMPDGKWHLFTVMPSSISLSISTGSYSFIGDYTDITGELDDGYCAMLVNATRKPADTTASITLGADCKAAYYCKELSKDDITITGTYETYTNNIIGVTSLIYVKASVYDASGAEVAFSESYFHIKNW